MLKILSWNIWHNGNLEQANDFLKNANANIIGLQEAMRKDGKIQLTDKLFKELGYRYVYAPAFQVE